jgi:hypothetical protein
MYFIKMCYGSYNRHSFGEQFSQKKWTREIAGQQEILAAYGGVRMEDVRGMRAPFLAVSSCSDHFTVHYDRYSAELSINTDLITSTLYDIII